MTSLTVTRKRVSVLAVVPMYNEADVVEHALRDLIRDGIDVYVIDNCSTDGTGEIARSMVGSGVVGVERFPDDSGFDPRARDQYVWRGILARIEQIAAASDHDWIVFSNADEFRESPWPGVSFREGLALVDELGYNAVNFELFDFRPTDDGFVPGTDVREHLRHWERGGEFDADQIKAWRNEGPALLVPSGGHSVAFAGRRVFPVPFLLRHYPIRGETHGRRKVFGERLPRFAPEERADGWHVQYDAFASGTAEFLRDPATLTEWDGDAVRAELLARAVVDVLRAQAVRPRAAGPELDATTAWFRRATGVAVDGAGIQVLADAVTRLPSADAAADADAPALAAMAALLASEGRAGGDLKESARLQALAEGLASRQARPFVSLAFADELIAAPELIKAYAAAVGEHAAARLVIAAPGADADSLLDALRGALAAVGLDEESAPEMVAVPIGSDDALDPSFAGGIDAVLSRLAPPEPLCRLPRFDDASAEALTLAVAA